MTKGDRVRSRGLLMPSVTGTVTEIHLMGEMPYENYVFQTWAQKLNISTKELMSEICYYVELDEPAPAYPGGPIQEAIAFPTSDLERA